MNLGIKIYEMLIDVIEQSCLRLEAERRGQAATERLNVTPLVMLLPKGFEVREQPAFSACPL